MIGPPQRRTVAALTLSAAALVGIVLHEGYAEGAGSGAHRCAAV
jgi:lysozyme